MEKLLQLLTLLGVICFFSMFIILGLVLTYDSTILLYESSMASLSWQTTEGVVTHSEIEPLGRGVKSGRSFKGAIRYDYTIEGEKYAGDRYRIGYLGNPDRRWARKIVDAHPVGTVVKVYYSSSSPATSVLVPGANWNVYVALVVGIAMFLVCTYFVFACARSAVEVMTM